MAYYKKQYNRRLNVYYPLAIVKGRPIETEVIAQKLAYSSTVTNSDVHAVLLDMAPVMHTYMAQGKSVHIKGLGYFRYVLSTKGVADVTQFDFEKQVEAVRVEFIPERKRLSNGTYTRAMVDDINEKIEWIELGAEAEDDAPGAGSGGGSTDSGGDSDENGDNDLGENPLG